MIILILTISITILKKLFIYKKVFSEIYKRYLRYCPREEMQKYTMDLGQYKFDLH